MKTYINKHGDYVIKNVNIDDVFNLDNNLLHIIVKLLKKIRQHSKGILVEENISQEEIIKPIQEAFEEVIKMREDVDYCFNQEATQQKLEEAFNLLSKEFFCLWI